METMNCFLHDNISSSLSCDSSGPDSCQSYLELEETVLWERRRVSLAKERVLGELARLLSQYNASKAQQRQIYVMHSEATPPSSAIKVFTVFLFVAPQTFIE